MIQNSHPSTTTTQVDAEAIFFFHRLPALPIVCGIFQGIHPVGKDLCLISPVSQEMEGKVDVALRPVRHRSDIPSRSLPAGNHRIFTQLSVYRHRLVEGGGDAGDEVRARLVLHVLRRTVCQHLQRSLEGDVHRASMRR